MSNLCDLKSFRGQSWSAWTDYIGYRIPPDLSERNIVRNTESQTKRLSRNDIPIFGHYPTAEMFELAVCNFCGNKFKLPALLEHITNRHEDGKVQFQKQDSSSMKTIEKVSDGSARNNKASLKTNTLTVAPMISNGKFSESLSPTPSSPNRSIQTLQVHVHLDRNRFGGHEKLPLEKFSKDEISLNNNKSTLSENKVKHVRVRLKKKQDDRKQSNEDVMLVKDVSASTVINSVHIRILQPTSMAGLGRQAGSTSISEQSKSANGATVCKAKEKLKDATEYSQKKFSSRHSVSNNLESSKKDKPVSSTFLKDLANNLETEKSTANALELQPLHRKINQINVEEDRRRYQTPKTTERRIGNGCSVRDRIYDPDKHCGVLAKKNSKPCTRSLTSCKTHSITLRRAVKGRSKAFDLLLADHRKNKEMARSILTELNTSNVIETFPTKINVIEPHEGQIISSKGHSRRAQSLRNESELSLPLVSLTSQISDPGNAGIPPPDFHATYDDIKTNFRNLNQIKDSDLPKNIQVLQIKEIHERKPEKSILFHGYQQWHPLWRRKCGLMYSFKTPVTHTKPVSSCSNVSWNDMSTTEIYQNQMPPPAVLQAVEQCTKALLAASTVPSRPTFYVSSPSKISSTPMEDMNMGKRPLSPLFSSNHVTTKKLRTVGGQISVLTTESLLSRQGRRPIVFRIGSKHKDAFTKLIMK